MISEARPVGEARQVGRPRSEEADRAILDAALQLFAEAGFDGLTVEGVAARAGVGKATIYRRYPGKVDLVMAAARVVCLAEVPHLDTGSVAEDLRAIARGLVHLLTETVAGPAVAQIVSELDRNPELRHAHSDFIATRRALTTAAVQRGVERGELVPETDAELVTDLVGGPIFYRYLLSGQPLDDAFADHLVESVLARSWLDVPVPNP
jgi:AcrR family transcriptional regulator